MARVLNKKTSQEKDKSAQENGLSKISKIAARDGSFFEKSFTNEEIET